MTIDRAFAPKLSKKARLRFDRHSGKSMIVYPERGLELNEAAAAIAKKCDGSRSIAAIAEELAREHEGASAAEIETDVLAFVEDLRKKGLLEIA
ncbi:MAG: pyrroloquinoline quinone biosynthesis peptide chaperone PqqD [Deltaproteobacteria bacterium]|nr:pyrroloquinoline quinone biosynthesis peptide chaperone PqqD [Deltaproteobacteria bacterium]